MSASNATPITGVVTVSYRSEAVLGTLIDSVAGATSTIYAGIVADNHPDRSIRVIAETAGWGYLPLGNPGYGAAINAAVAALPASVEWIVVTNPDVEFRSGAIDSLISVANTHDRAGAVGPKILEVDGTVYPSARAIPSLRMGVGHALFSRIWPSNPWTARYLRPTSFSPGNPSEVGWLSGACLLLKRSTFERLGGFDESYFMYFEDVDLGVRLGKAGFVSVYDPDAVIVHLQGHSTGTESIQMIDAHHRSARLFIQRKYSGPLLAPVRLILDLGLRVRARVDRRLRAR